MSIPTIHLCYFCKHAGSYKDWKDDEFGSPIPKCPAFPDGIPIKVHATGQSPEYEFLHFEKYPDQKNDIVFEPIEDSNAVWKFDGRGVFKSLIQSFKNYQERKKLIQEGKLKELLCGETFNEYKRESRKVTREKMKAEGKI